MRQTEKIALVNGQIHTPTGIADSVTIEAGRISEAGAFPDTRHDARVIDLHGRTVLPGFCDSHAGLMKWAAAQEQVQLNGCRSIEDIQAALRSFADARPSPAGGWYQGQGWSPELMQGAIPARRDIDAVLPDTPAILWRAHGHAAVVNSAALRAAGIREPDTEEPVANADDGILTDDALDAVARCIPPMNDGELEHLLKTCAPRAASLGLTEISSDDLDVFGGDFRNAQKLFMPAALSGGLPFRLRCLLHIQDRDALLDFLSDGWRSGDGVPFFQAGPLKIVVEHNMQQDALDGLVTTAHLSGMQIALQPAGGDRELLDRCLASLERARNRRRMTSRHAVICAPSADGIQDAQLDKILALRPGLIMHPCSIPLSGQGPRWRLMARRGLVLASGSGAGILSPLAVIQAIVTGGPAADDSRTGSPDERLSLAEALGTCTWSAAWNGGNEKRRGEIAPGRDADLVILEQDPFSVRPEELANVEVAMTFCGGRVTYSSGSLD